MAVRTISTKLAIEGEAEYKAKLKSLNADLALHKSELEKIQAEYKNNANSLSALESTYSVLEAQLSSLNEKHETQEEMLGKAYDAYNKYVKEVAELRVQQEALNASTSVSADEQKKLQEAISKAESGMEKAANSVIYYQKQLNNTERDQSNLRAELDQTKKYLDEARSSSDRCAVSIDQYGKEVKEAGAASKEFGSQSTGAVEALAQALVTAGVTKGIHEITEALLECSDAAGAFEKSIFKISTISDPSVMSLDEMRSKILQISNDANIAATSIGEAVYQAISSGVATEEAFASVEKAAKLSIGGFTSVETSVDVLTTALNAYKLSAEETTRVSDSLIITQKKGKTSVDELANSVGKVIPLAAAYNVQLDNLGASYSILTTNGIATAEAGTYLKSMFSELGDSGSKVAKILMEKTGQSFAELSKSGRSVGDVLDLLGDSVGGSTTAFGNLWSSTEAGTGALSLFKSGVDQFNSVLEEMQDSAGATEAAYQKMARGSDFASQRMANAAENLKIAIGEQLNPALTQLYNTGADAFTWAADFVEENPEIVGATVAVTAGIGALTAGLTLAANASAIAAAKQAVLNAVMSANPAYLLAAGMTALVAAITAYSMTVDHADAEAQAFVRSLRESKDAYQELTEAMEGEQSSVSDSIRALENLLAVEDKSAAQKDVILQMVEKLNQSVPGLNLVYDAAADSINMATDALERMADAAGDQEKYEAQIGRLNDLYSERENITRNLADAQDELDEALANAQWDSFGGAANEAAVHVDQLRGAVDVLTAAQAENAAQIAAMEEATAAYSQQQETAAGQTEEMTARMEGLIAEIQTLEEAYNESYQAAMDSINSQMGLFQEMDGTAKTSIDNLIDTLKGQVAYMETYNENILKAMEMGVDQGLIRKLSDGSEQSAQILDAIVKGGTEDIAALNEQLAKVEEGKETFSTTVAEMETEFDKTMEALSEDLQRAFDEMDLYDDTFKIGKNDVQGLLDGTNALSGTLITKYREMAESALAAYKQAVGQHSPSVKYREAGSYDIRGLIEGAESEKGHLKAAYIDLAETGTLGVAEGIAANGSKAVKAADKLAGEVYSRNKDWIDRQTKYQKLTLREQLDVWEAIQRQFIRESKQYAEAEEKIFDLKAKMQDEYYKKVEEVNKKIIKLEDEYRDAVTKRTKEIFDSYNLFDEVADREEVSGQQLVKNLENQVKRMKEFYSGLRELSARGVGDALVEEIREMGPSAAGQLDALLELSDLKLQEFTNLYNEKQRIANQQALEELRSLREETDVQIQASLNEISDVYGREAPAVGQSFADGLAKGMVAGSSTAASAAASVAQEAVDAAGRVIAGASKSIGGISYDPNVDYAALMAEAKDLNEFEALAAKRNAKIIGENIDLVGAGFADNAQLLAQWQKSYEEASANAQAAITAMADDVTGQIDELNRSAPEMGKDFIGRLIEGIEAEKSALLQTVRRVCRDMQLCTEAEMQPVRQQIQLSMSNLADRIDQASVSGQSDMAGNIASAVRDVMNGAAVIMNRRKVGEMITDWQRNEDKSWGE